jgi:hypothetical protein
MLESIPDGYILQSDQTQVEAIESKVLENDIATVTSKTTLTLIPMIDTQEVARNIQGKYPPVTQNYFKTLPNFVRTETTITPALPSRLNTFPHKLENITIEVKPVSAPPKPS